MDLALAHHVAGRFAEKKVTLDPWQSVALWHSCRTAKEMAPVSKMGQSSRSTRRTLRILPAVNDQRQPKRVTARAGTTEHKPRVSPMGRWVEVLNAFLRRDEWGVRDLAAETGIPRSAVHRILHEMQR